MSASKIGPLPSSPTLAENSVRHRVIYICTLWCTYIHMFGLEEAHLTTITNYYNILYITLPVCLKSNLRVYVVYSIIIFRFLLRPPSTKYLHI